MFHMNPTCRANRHFAQRHQLCLGKNLISPSLDWINERLFVGNGARYPDKMVMHFFEIA